MSFKDLLFNMAPWWMQNRVAGTLLGVVGGQLDAATETLIEGLHASDPLKAQADALSQISEDRKIRIYDTEPEDSKRARLAAWRKIHRHAGSHYGDLADLQPYFLPDTPVMRIVHQSGPVTNVATWHTLDSAGNYTVHRADPSNWDYDGIATKVSRFYVIVYTSGPVNPIYYDSGHSWNDGSLWDGDPSTAQIAEIVDIAKGKAPHAKLWAVILASDPASFDPTAVAVTDPDGWTSLPTGNWGFVIDNATGDPSRPPTASWIYDLGQS